MDDLVKKAKPYAVWFNIKNNGQKVAVKASHFDDSYPAQADAIEVELLIK